MHLAPRLPCSDLRRIALVITVCACVTGLSPTLVTAQESEKKRDANVPMKHIPEDLRYGNASSAEAQVALPGTNLDVPAVDRRDEVDALAIQGAIFPNAHIPKKYRFIYRNQLIFGQQFAIRGSDRLMLNATWVISPGSLSSDMGGDFDRRLGAHARGIVYERGDVSVAVQGGFQQQKGLYLRDTKIFSAQLSTHVDYKISDHVILGAGLLGNAPLRMTYTDFNLDDCENRGDFIEETCIEYDTIAEGFPPGGQFAMGWVGLTYYGPRQLFIKSELFSSVRRGTILGLDGSIYNDDSLESQLERYRFEETYVGVVEGAPLGLALSTGWTYKRVSIQGTLIMLPGAWPDVDNRDDGSVGIPPHIFPMMSLGVGI